MGKGKGVLSPIPTERAGTLPGMNENAVAATQVDRTLLKLCAAPSDAERDHEAELLAGLLAEAAGQARASRQSRAVRRSSDQASVRAT